jgi:hypothetical protein
MPGQNSLPKMEYVMTFSTRKSLIALLGGLTLGAASVAVANDAATGGEQNTDPRHNTQQQSQPDYNRQGGSPYGGSQGGATGTAPGTTGDAPANQGWGGDQSDDSDDEDDDRDNGERTYP